MLSVIAMRAKGLYAHGDAKTAVARALMSKDRGLETTPTPNNSRLPLEGDAPLCESAFGCDSGYLTDDP